MVNETRVVNAKTFISSIPPCIKFVIYVTTIYKLESRLQHNIQIECGKYSGILRGILSVPHNEPVYLINVMNDRTRDALRTRA
jgi:hypothetical protein